MVDALQQWIPSFLVPYFTSFMQFGEGLFGTAWNDIVLTVWTVIKIMLIIMPLLMAVAYTTFWERKVIGWMQVRIGPNRVGPWGLIQPIADGLKLLFKEVVIPSGADKAVFLLAPIFAFAPALAAWAVIPFNDYMVLATSTPACSISWQLRRSGCMESFSPVGHRTPNMPSLAACVRRLSSFRMKLRWVCRWWSC